MPAAKFYDGISSLARKTPVEFRGDELSFEITDADGHGRRLTWKKSEVKHEQLSGGLLHKLSLLAQPTVFLEFQGTGTEVLEDWLKQNAVKSVSYKVLLSRSVLVGILIVSLSIIPLLYFFVLPEVADYTAARLPEEYDIELGNRMSSQLLAGSPEDVIRSAYCDSIVTELGGSFRFPIKIHVIPGNTVNAFALPGGHIFVYHGMLNACNNKEEFAALLGHEIGHVEMRHSSRAIMRALVNSALLSVVLGDFSAIAGMAAEQANELKNLEFSRKLESNADEFSINLLINSHINPQGVVGLFQTLKKEEEKAGMDIPEFLSSHPLSQNREKEAIKNIRKRTYTIRENPDLERFFKAIRNLTAAR